MKPDWIVIGAVLGALAVVTGAFAAHLLQDRLSPVALDWWKTAVLYHALHAPAIVMYGVFDRERRRDLAPWCMTFGVVAFSGSLYALALGAPGWLGTITPVGGVLLIAGWLAFALQAQQLRQRG